MEFRYRAGEEKERVSASIDPLIDSSSSFTFSTTSSYSYFTQQAILAGIENGHSGNDRPSMTKESLLEEIRKKRQREEMLMKEIARKRMLEEEILRQLENGSKIENKDAWSGSECEKSSFVNQTINSGFTEFRLMDELKEAESIIAGPAKFSKPEMPRVSLDRKFPASKWPGVKRKASDGLSDSLKKEWSCSLCNVTTTSENNLNVHINGKKHKAKEARLISNSTTSFKKSIALYTFGNEDDKPGDEGTDITINEHADEAHQGRKNNQPNNENDTDTWCRDCKACCNCSSMHQIHQYWRNVKARSEANTSESAEAVTKEITEEETVKEVNIEANEETLATSNFEASKETLLTEAQDNVEANEENVGKNDV